VIRRLCVLPLLAASLAVAQQPAAPPPAGQSPFLSIPAAPSDELRFDSPFPDFEAKDINGRTWRNADFQGKLTLIYHWHTFEARATDALDPHARQVIQSLRGLPELPELQAFYEKTRDNKNVQVLTFCRDYDYTHAHDYMKQMNYSFPVIADWVLAKKLFHGTDGQFRQWLVNPQGRLSYPLVTWTFGRLLFEVEAAAGRN
jgi:peroxiredoxin